MKLGSTIILKTVISVIGLLVLAFCLIALPQGIMSELKGDFDYGPIFVGMLVSALPFFYGLQQAFRLLGYIDDNLAFSDKAVTALRNIKHSALAISILYILGMPYIFYVGDRDDAPGVVAVGLVIIGASFVIATAAALFQRLFQNAVDIKAENELTV